MHPAVLVHHYFSVFGERVHNRRTDTMETARDFVCIMIKFTSCMECRHDGLKRRYFCLRVYTDWNAVAVVGDTHVIVRQKRHLYFIASRSHRFVASIVKNFPNEVMEAVGTGCSDIHSRSLAHRF